MIYIGIDPGVSTGVAVWDSQSKSFSVIKTLTFWETIEKISTIKAVAMPGYTVILEDPNANKPTFFHGSTASRVREKISQNVGSNKRDAQLIHEYCLLNKIPMQLVPPSKRGKLTAESFRNITGYKERCSQHGRDAAMLVFGR